MKTIKKLLLICAALFCVMCKNDDETPSVENTRIFIPETILFNRLDTPNQNRTITFAYDNEQRISSLSIDWDWTVPRRSYWEITYDGSNRLHTVIQQEYFNEDLSQDDHLEFVYNDQNNLTEIQLVFDDETETTPVNTSAIGFELYPGEDFSSRLLFDENHNLIEYDSEFRNTRVNYSSLSGGVFRDLDVPRELVLLLRWHLDYVLFLSQGVVSSIEDNNIEGEYLLNFEILNTDADSNITSLRVSDDVINVEYTINYQSIEL